MNEKEIFDVMIKEYKGACYSFYEARYGEKINVEYTIKDRHDGTVINRSVSGAHMDRVAQSCMATIRRMMISIYGDQVNDTLERIRKKVRTEEKEFFENHPEFIMYITKWIM